MSNDSGNAVEEALCKRIADNIRSWLHWASLWDEYVTDIPFIHTSCMVYIDYRFNLHLIIHARPLVRILGHGCSDGSRACNPTSIHVVSACDSPLRQDGHTQFLLQSDEMRETTVIKRGLLIDLKKKKPTHYAANIYQREQPAWSL